MITSIKHLFFKRYRGVSLVLGIVFAVADVRLGFCQSDQSSYERWYDLLSSRCVSIRQTHQVQLESLSTHQSIVAIYPKTVSVHILEWVGQGGSIFLTLNQQTVDGSRALLDALDLRPIKSTLNTSGLRGAWPYPQSQLDQKGGSTPLLTPWITIDPLSFEEGNSWLRGGITPIAIEENGYSLAYRVRYGQGTISLFGDGDALSDQLLVLPENQRLSQSITWWITKPREGEKMSCDVIWLSTYGEIISSRDQLASSQRFKRLLRELSETLSGWFDLRDHPQRSLYLGSFGLILFSVLGLIVLTSHKRWKRRYPLRRG